MARLGDEEVDAERGEVVVERKVVPVHRRYSLLAVILLVVFVLTCVVVFFGHRLGLREPAPAEKVQRD